MGTLITLSDSEWRPFEDSDGASVLSTSAKRAVCHSVGGNGHPVLLTQLAADPAHPFTAGQMVFTAAAVTFRDGSVVDLAHSDDYPRDALLPFPEAQAHTVHSGGFYLSDYRVPLEWRIAIAGGTPNYFEIELFRPDHAIIDADDRDNVAITISPDTEASPPPANIVITDADSTPAGGMGGVILRKALTDAQLTSLQATPTRKKIGVTIAAAATTPVISFSAYDETHPTREQAEYLLRNAQTIGLQAPSTGGWYARATRPTSDGPTKIYVGD